jgi:hypothetical protein
MKTILSKINLATLALLLLVLASFSSCKKDDDDTPIQQQGIEGKWNVTSFVLDDVEIKGIIIAASEMEFDADNSTTGDFSWSITYKDNSNDTVTGEYVVVGDKIHLDSHGDEVLEYDLKLTDNSLEIRGEMDEGYVKVTAARK